MGYSVKTALVLARDADGRFLYLYHGAQVPKDVPDEEVERLFNEGFLSKGEVDITSDPVPVSGEPEKDDPEDMTLDELRTYAQEHSIDLGGATRKPDVLAAVKSASK